MRLQRRLAELEKSTSATNSKQTLLYNQLIDSYGTMERKVNEMDAITKIVDTTVKRLEDRLSKAPVPKNGEEGTLPKERPAVASIPAQVASVLRGLKTRNMSVEEAVLNLKNVALESTPLLTEQLTKPLGDRAYRNAIESVLSNLPLEAIQKPVTDLLALPGMVRMSAARIIRNHADRTLSGALEEYTKSPDEDFRLVIGEALVASKNPAGVPVLVASLKSKEYSNRVIAIDLLRKLNGGKDYGYRASKSEEENTSAMKQWDNWRDGAGKELFTSK
ncbi:MAG: HEAT repeat domain-containing protein [Planctomycetota bacterium]|nr:HEAT repeat domain-containing protein [Planctomycetota bacterium]